MEYVEQRNGGYYVAGTRISLDSVVYAHLRGESPDGIVCSYPSLNLEQVRGALGFYEANREHVHEYLKRQEADYARLYEEARRKDPEFYASWDAIRKEFRKLNGRQPDAEFHQKVEAIKKGLVTKE